MKTLEQDLKETLQALYNNKDEKDIFIIDGKIVDKRQLQAILEFKLLCVINMNRING